jgi:hypothetical protein
MSDVPDYRVEVFPPVDWARDGGKVSSRLNELAALGWRLVGPPTSASVDGVARLIYTLVR